jgi:hypothetical protein
VHTSDEEAVSVFTLSSLSGLPRPSSGDGIAWITVRDANPGINTGVALGSASGSRSCAAPG